jgi:hypothetical protein
MRKLLKLLPSTTLWMLFLSGVLMAQQEEAPKSTETANPMGAHTWFIIAAVGALLAWCISYSIQAQREAAARKQGRETLIQRKEQILDEIAGLEGLKDTGNISETKYKKQLKELKVRLSQVLEQLGVR